jgi:Na+/melibiose symporter-like transporter
VQSPRALDGIRLTSSIYAAIPFFLGVICLLFYKIDKRLNVQITDELAERRRQSASAEKARGIAGPPPGVVATGEIVFPEAP